MFLISYDAAMTIQTIIILSTFRYYDYGTLFLVESIHMIGIESFGLSFKQWRVERKYNRRTLDSVITYNDSQLYEVF